MKKTTGIFQWTNVTVANLYTYWYLKKEKHNLLILMVELLKLKQWQAVICQHFV